MVSAIDPDDSWYQPDLNLTKAQQNYIDLLEEIWMMVTPAGKPIPYNMTPYQREYHANSLNVLAEDADHILWNKARGISFTYSTLIELIMTAASFDNQEIPVISHREKSSWKILDVGKELIRNCKLDEIKDNAHFTEKSSYIEFQNTGSTIRVYPSSAAADAVRSTRLIRGVIDEFAFQRSGKSLWTAASNTMQGEMGQWIIGSTPNGRQNHFFNLVDQSRKDDIGFKLFELPMFNPEEVDLEKPLTDQDIKPIAPWASIDQLEDRRREDKRMFEQENMCSFLDEGIALIDYQSIISQTRSKLPNYAKKLRETAGFTYEPDNNMVFGVDVAEEIDLFACTGFEIVTTSNGETYFVQRYLDYFNGVKIPELEKYLTKILERFPTIESMRIDSTGMGSALPSYLHKDYPRKVEGVKFSTSIKTKDGVNVKIRDAMCFNFKKQVENGNVFLIDDQEQVNHINAITYELDVKDSGEGHGDIFFADALALLDNTKSMKQKQDMYTKRLWEEEKKSIEEETIMDRVERYRKQQGRNTRGRWT